MKEWPKDEETANFEELCQPFVEALHFMFNMQRRNSDADVPYDGYENGPHNAATTPPIASQLTAESLRYNEEDQGRSPEETLIGAILQVGIEQGRRITKKRIREFLMYRNGELAVLEFADGPQRRELIAMALDPEEGR